MTRARRVLVIGVGNTLRSDDGAGVRAAELIARRFPQITVATVQEPHPELAEAIAGCSDVLFLDASTRVDTLTVTPVAADGGSAAEGTHACSPATLLALSASLYDHVPDRALLVEIPAQSFAFGETLSPATTRMIHECAGFVGRHIEAECM